MARITGGPRRLIVLIFLAHLLVGFLVYKLLQPESSESSMSMVDAKDRKHGTWNTNSLSLLKGIQDQKTTNAEPPDLPALTDVRIPAKPVVTGISAYGFTDKDLKDRKEEIFLHLPLAHVDTDKKFVLASLNSRPGSLGEYVRGQAVLAYSLKKHLGRQDVVLILFYLENTLQDLEMQYLVRAGWDMLVMLPNLLPMKLPSRESYAALFAKLWIFAMDQFETVVLLDADMMATDDIGELFYDRRSEKIYFAACRDNMFGNWVTDINAGLLLVHPNVTVFRHLINTAMEEWNSYETEQAEQGFLNYFIRHKCPSCLKRLSMDYNANYVVYQNYPDLWEGQANKIIHFTTQKPFYMTSTNIEDHAPNTPLRLWLENEEALHLSMHDFEIQLQQEAMDDGKHKINPLVS